MASNTHSTRAIHTRRLYHTQALRLHTRAIYGKPSLRLSCCVPEPPPPRLAPLWGPSSAGVDHHLGITLLPAVQLSTWASLGCRSSPVIQQGPRNWPQHRNLVIIIVVAAAAATECGAAPAFPPVKVCCVCFQEAPLCPDCDSGTLCSTACLLCCCRLHPFTYKAMK